MSDVKITGKVTVEGRENGEVWVTGVDGTTGASYGHFIRAEAVSALRAHFAAEIDDPNHAYVIGYRKALDDVAERMPEDVQKLVDEAREWPRHGGDNYCGVCAGPCGGWPDEPVGDQDGLVKRLAAALEAAYSQKGVE